MAIEQLTNFVNGTFVKSGTNDYLPVKNPATAQIMTQVPLSPAQEVDVAVQAAVAAFKEWRRTPVGERIQPLFKLKTLMEANRDMLARTITDECGKTFEESSARAQPCRLAVKSEPTDADIDHLDASMLAVGDVDRRRAVRAERDVRRFLSACRDAPRDCS